MSEEKYNKKNVFIDTFDEIIYSSEKHLEAFSTDIDAWVNDFSIEITDPKVFIKKILDAKEEYHMGVRRYERARESIRKRKDRHLIKEMCKAVKSTTHLLEVLEDPEVMKYTGDETKKIIEQLPEIKIMLLAMAGSMYNTILVDIETFDKFGKNLLEKGEHAKTKKEQEELLNHEHCFVNFYKYWHELRFDMNQTRTKQGNRVFFVHDLALIYLEYTTKTSLNREKTKESKSPFYAFVKLCFNSADKNVHEDAIKKIIAEAKKQLLDPTYTSTFNSWLEHLNKG